MIQNKIATLPLSEIETVSTEALRAQLAQSLTITAQSLAYLATIWRELERRGEDLSDLRGGLSVYLPQIAAGTLAAEAVVRYAGQRMLLRALSKLPISLQREIVERGDIPRVTIGNGGEAKTVTAPLHSLSSADVAVVFAEDRVRSTEEQYHLLQGKTEGRTRVQRYARQVRVTDDGMLVGGRLAKIERVTQALSDYYGIDVAAAIEEKKARKEKT